MTGLRQDKEVVDSQAGQLAIQLRDLFEKIRRFKVWLDRAETPAALTAMGETTDEITLLNASFTAFDKLRLIGEGQATQPAASDFWWDARKLIGPNVGS